MGAKHSQKTKEMKALSLLREAGFEVPDEMPSETMNDSAREAQAVIWYFETGGKPFKEKPCKYCGQIFAYCWDSTAIAYCSIECSKKRLREIGLDWNHHKPPAERWGRTVPAVVPPEALDLLKEILDPPEDLHLDTTA